MKLLSGDEPFLGVKPFSGDEPFSNFYYLLSVNHTWCIGFMSLNGAIAMIYDNERPRILRLTEVTKTTGLSRSTIYELMKAKNFPQSLKLGLRSVGWVQSEIDAWVTSAVEKRDRLQSVSTDCIRCSNDHL